MPVRAENVRQFYVSNELTGETGKGEKFALGTFEMCVKVAHNADITKISFWNVMPDSSQYLIVDDVPVTKVADGSMAFDFDDNWNNKGHGSLNISAQVATIKIDIVRATDHAWGRNAGRNYGTTKLPEANCPRRGPN